MEEDRAGEEEEIRVREELGGTCQESQQKGRDRRLTGLRPV